VSETICFTSVIELTIDSHLTSPIVTVIVGKSKTFHLHFDLLVAESERFSAGLKGNFKEAQDHTINIEDEDPEIFGFFVEYIYRDKSLLSRQVSHYSEYVTLARLYAMGDRLMAKEFKAQCLWRFTESLGSSTAMSEESICELLHIACTEIMERAKEDPMRSQIFWCAGTRISKLQKFGVYRKLLRDEPEVGQQMCLWVEQRQPSEPAEPVESRHKKFEDESEYPSS
jgi:hypothetical protein